MIELFKNHYKPRSGSLLLPEVWCVANEIANEPSASPKLQCSSKARRAVISRTRVYYDGEASIYKHIVLPVPTSKFGKDFLRPEFGTKFTLWWMRRGARYVAVTNP